MPMKTFVLAMFLPVAMANLSSAMAANSGTGQPVKRGDTRVDVESKRGEPARKDTTYFDGNCNGRQDVYRYAPREAGELGQTIYLCDNRVVDIKYGR